MYFLFDLFILFCSWYLALPHSQTICYFFVDNTKYYEHFHIWCVRLHWSCERKQIHTATCSEKLSVTCAWCLLFTFVYYREREHKRTLQSALVIAKVRFKVVRLAASTMISVILHCLCFSGWTGRSWCFSPKSQSTEGPCAKQTRSV